MAIQLALQFTFQALQLAYHCSIIFSWHDSLPFIAQPQSVEPFNAKEEKIQSHADCETVLQMPWFLDLTLWLQRSGGDCFACIDYTQPIQHAEPVLANQRPCQQFTLANHAFANPANTHNACAVAIGTDALALPTLPI